MTLFIYCGKNKWHDLPDSGFFHSNYIMFIKNNYKDHHFKRGVQNYKFTNLGKDDFFQLITYHFQATIADPKIFRRQSIVESDNKEHLKLTLNNCDCEPIFEGGYLK